MLENSSRPDGDAANTPVTYVYVLVSMGKLPCRSYVGWTLDLDRRLSQHNGADGHRGGAKSTRGRRWVLVYAEKCAGRGAALKREYALKNDRKFRAALRCGSGRALPI